MAYFVLPSIVRLTDQDQMSKALSASGHARDRSLQIAEEASKHEVFARKRLCGLSLKRRLFQKAPTGLLQLVGCESSMGP